MRNYIISIFSIVLLSSLSAQEDEHHKVNNEKGIYELIASGITSYSTHEDKWVEGVEFHSTYWINHVFGTGISYTAKFNEHITSTDMAILGSWNPQKWLTLNVGPNFAFANKERAFEIGAYLEVEFNVRPSNWFHFGPVIGILLAKSSEYIFGLHLGFEIE